MEESPGRRRLRSKTPSWPDDGAFEKKTTAAQVEEQCPGNLCEVCQEAFPDSSHCKCPRKIQNMVNFMDKDGETPAKFVNSEGAKCCWLRLKHVNGVLMVGCLLCSGFMGGKIPHPTSRLNIFGYVVADKHFSISTVKGHVQKGDKGEHGHCLREFLRATGRAASSMQPGAVSDARTLRDEQNPSVEVLNYAYLVWVAIVLPMSATGFVAIAHAAQAINADIPGDLWQSHYGFSQWLQAYNITGEKSSRLQSRTQSCLSHGCCLRLLVCAH